jgi:hypothetical protein
MKAYKVELLVIDHDGLFKIEAKGGRGVDR